MAQWWIFLIIVLSFFGALIVMMMRSRGASRAGTPMLRAKTIVLDDEYGLAFAFEMQRTSDGGYSYLVKTALEGMRQKVYGEDELLDLNKHLNVIGNQIYITRTAVLKLADKIDFIKSLDKIKSLESQNDVLEAENRLLKANQATSIKDNFEMMGSFMEKARPMRIKPR